MTNSAGSAVQAQYQLQLCTLVRKSTHLMNSLRTVRSLGVSSWCIGAGAIRSMVWDELHRFQSPSTVDDMDVAYFDPCAPLHVDAQLQQQLMALHPGVNWEVVNQAKVHEWYESTFGQAIPPLESLESGLAIWPEYATCVGVYLVADDDLHVIAPHGLNDLFELRVRHNPTQVPAETFMQRVRQKRFAQRWPMLTINS